MYTEMIFLFSRLLPRFVLGFQCGLVDWPVINVTLRWFKVILSRFLFLPGRNRVEDCGSAKTECWSFRNEITTRNVGWKSVGINDDIHTRNDMPQHLAAAFLLLLFLIIYLIRLASWHKTKEEDWFLTGHHHYCWTRSVRRWAEE